MVHSLRDSAITSYRPIVLQHAAMREQVLYADDKYLLS
jgi:hypothetical protein